MNADTERNDVSRSELPEKTIHVPGHSVEVLIVLAISTAEYGITRR